MRTWQAVVLPALSFVLMHDIFGLIALPFLFAGTPLISGLFLWRRSLTATIYLHALLNMMSVAGV